MSPADQGGRPQPRPSATIDLGAYVRGPKDAVPARLSQQLPLFAAIGAVLVLAGLVPFPSHQIGFVVVAGVLYLGLIAASLLLPWDRLPRWSFSAVPVGYVAVIALVRHAQGGALSGLGTLYILPVLWIAFYGRRVDLVVGLAAVAVALVVPVLLPGLPTASAGSWRAVAVTMVVTALVSSTVLAMVARERAHAEDLSAQSDLARQAARQADEARQRLASLVQAATETAVVAVDGRATVTFFSAGAEHLLGYRAEEAVGTMTVYDFLDPAELERRHLTGAGAPDAVALLLAVGDESVWSCRRKDGRQVRLAATITSRPEEGDGDQANGFVVVATDVTQREQLEAERERLLAVQREVTQVLVEQNQQLRELTQMKDDVVATVSHELRTPLTSIRGFVELLLDEDGPPLDDEQAHMVRAIERNSHQLLKVADDLLADPGGGRQLRVEFVDTDLAQLAHEAVEAMAATAFERTISVATQAPGPAVVHGDPLRLHQLLGNLLSNALKFTPAGGRVLVEVEAVGPFVRLDVLDSGQGVPAGQRTALFDRFYRLASTSEQGIPGSGLGLAIAKSVVEAHHGTIEVVDVPGWSTAFRVLLPATTSAADRTPPPVGAGSPGRNGRPALARVGRRGVASEQ